MHLHLQSSDPDVPRHGAHGYAYTVEFDDEERIDLTDLDFFVPATARELLATLTEEPDAPVILSPALAVVVGRLLMGPDPTRVLEDALRAQHG